MESSRLTFLDLVPLVHSGVRGWSVRAMRAKDVQVVKALNVCGFDGRRLITGSIFGDYVSEVVLFTVFV